MRRIIGALAAVFIGVAAAGVSAASAETVVTLWSHWADQQTKVAFVEKAARNFEAKNPGTTVKITWYQKGPLNQALEAALRARKGPDIFYIDTDKPEFVESGFTAPLDDLINWNNVEPWARKQWIYKEKTYALPLEASTVELYYNTEIMKKLGADPGPDNQFAQAAFFDLVKRAKAAGITPIVQGVGDRPFPGAYVPEEMILQALGPDDFQKLLDGRLSWKDSRIGRSMGFVQQLVQAGAYPASFTSLKLGESHYYFYASPGGLMLPMGSWYTSRAFNPPDKGGQPEGFPLGIMQFPALDGAACGNCKELTIAGSFAVNAQSPHVKLAAALLNEMATPEMGNLWLSTVLGQTGVKTDPSKIEGPHKAYLQELLAIDAKNTLFIGNMLAAFRGECREVFEQVINVAFPAGLMKADEAAERMNKACFKG